MRLLEVYKKYLRETNCPNCGADGAYVGLNDVECQSPNCKFFKDNSGSQPSVHNSTSKYQGYPSQYTGPGKDYFAGSKQSWIDAVSKECDRTLGHQWRAAIDHSQGGKKGAADWLLEELWRLGYGKKHAVLEVAFFHDLATSYAQHLQGGIAGSYPHAVLSPGKPSKINPAWDFGEECGVGDMTIDDFVDNGGDRDKIMYDTGDDTLEYAPILRPERK